MSFVLVHSTVFRFKQHRRLQLRKCVAVSATQGSNSWENEEARWLREEQRWIRDEQRWLREEKRWNAEKAAWAVDSAQMLAEIQLLKAQVERLQSEKSDGTVLLRDLLVTLKALLSSRTGSTQGAAPSFPKEFPSQAAAERQVASSTSVPVPAPDPPAPAPVEENGAAKSTIKRTLRSGSEGEDVKLLQDALAKLGFYSGEEEMEDCYFADGTERAVKTWQSSVGVAEDGAVTAQLLKKLVSEQGFSSTVTIKDAEQESPSSTALVKEVEVIAAKSTVVAKETAVASSRVFLLGENRWEDSSRLVQVQGSAQSCHFCGGRGKTVCLECDGTGELIVEEQFVDWAGDDPKCPYCEGSGIVACDDCDGRGTASA